MQTALHQLGFYHCYHMQTLLRNLDGDDPDLWIRALQGKYGNGKPFERKDWDQLLGQSQACCDMPAALFGVELAELYPEAKVVILNRDPEKWYGSAGDTVHKNIMPQTFKEALTSFYIAALDSSYRNRTRFTRAMIKYAMPFYNGKGHDEEKDEAIAWFNARYEEFRTRIPAERCLEFVVKDGWKPLCEHLGVPVPTVKDHVTGEMVEAPFPHVNDRQSFSRRRVTGQKGTIARANGALIRAIGKLLAMAILVFAGYVMYRRSIGTIT
jgi:hypothetical protein